MKKIAKKIRRQKKDSSGLRGGKSSPLIAIAIIAVVSLTGIGLLKASFAQTTNYIYLTVRNKSNNAPIPNAITSLGARAGSLCQGQNYWTAYTEPTGVASYACEPGTYVFYDVGYPGYHTVLDGSGYIPGTEFQHSSTTSLTLYMEPWPAPQITLTASPATITKGSSSTINWTTQYTDNCSAVGGWQSSNAASGSIVIAPASTTTYTLSCPGNHFSGTTATKSVTVNVNSSASPPPAPPPAKAPSPTPPASSTKKVATSQATPPPPAPAVVKATTGDTTPPDKPDSLTVIAKDGKAQLSWDKAADNVGVAGYSVERSSGSEDWTYLTSLAPTTTYEDSTIGNSDSIFSYRVRAVDAAGNQSEATYGDLEIKATPTGPTKDQSVAKPKNKSAFKVVLKVSGAILLVAALAGGVYTFIKWRASHSIGALDYDDSVRQQTVENAIHTVENDTPHQAESLKDMVLHDMNPDDPAHTDQHKP
jgi:hypothetical protein